jgi:hypothetical protein
MTTLVPPLQIISTGLVVPTEAAILTGVQQDMNAAFGGNLNPSLETPQGQLATSETAIIAAANAQFAAMLNSFDPAYATGRMQDAIGRIYDLTRLPAVSTSVAVTLTGISGTVIPVNAQAVATDGSIYLNTAAVTIPVGGSIAAVFECSIPGPTACPAGTLNQVYRSISGWDSITNAADGVLGQFVESRAAFETRRQLSVSANSQGMLVSILGNVLNVAGVLDAYVNENNTSSPITVTGVTIVANSIYICVDGGANADIAEAILKKKMPGCNYNGTTTVVVTDTNPLYSPNFPSYSIKFQRPAALPILFAISILNTSAVPADAVVQIQNAIISAFAGGDGGPRARIGATLFASRYYATIAALGAWAQIVSIQIGTSVANLNQVVVPINEIPTTAAVDIAVTLI